ncbi:MAG: hypothetical protein WCD18_04855 [Thermosynechococcaceae cyanobacterium]
MNTQLIGQWTLIDDRLAWVWTTVEADVKPNRVELRRPVPALEKVAA